MTRTRNNIREIRAANRTGSFFGDRRPSLSYGDLFFAYLGGYVTYPFVAFIWAWVIFS